MIFILKKDNCCILEKKEWNFTKKSKNPKTTSEKWLKNAIIHQSFCFIKVLLVI